jgi:hypothetical protein
MGAEHGAVVVRFEKIFEGRIIFFAVVEARFYRGIGDFHRVFGWIFVVIFVVVNAKNVVLSWSCSCVREFSSFPRFIFFEPDARDCTTEPNPNVDDNTRP